MSSRQRVRTSRRAALAGGAALVLGGAIGLGTAAAQPMPPVGEQRTWAPLDQAQVAPDKDVIFFSSGTPVDVEKHRAEWFKAVATKLGVSADRLQTAIQDVTRETGLPPLLLPGVVGGAPPATGAVMLQRDSGFAAVAKAIGISEEQLRKEHTAGKSFTEIARAHNANPEAVGEALKAQRRADIDRAVAQGKLPA